LQANKAISQNLTLQWNPTGPRWRYSQSQTYGVLLHLHCDPEKPSCVFHHRLKKKMMNSIFESRLTSIPPHAKDPAVRSGATAATSAATCREGWDPNKEVPRRPVPWSDPGTWAPFLGARWRSTSRKGCGHDAVMLMEWMPGLAAQNQYIGLLSATSSHLANREDATQPKHGTTQAQWI
jgi:hypothetical protein